MYNFTTADEDIKSKIIDRIFNRPKTGNKTFRLFNLQMFAEVDCLKARLNQLNPHPRPATFYS